MDPIELVFTGFGVVFGAGTAYGALRHTIKTVLIQASTAAQQADTALTKIGDLKTEVANERTERVRLGEKLASLDREVALREELRKNNDEMAVQTAYLDAIAKRTGSDTRSVPKMAAVRPSVPREEPPSDPPPTPPVRPRLPSRGGRGYGGE